MDDLVLTPLAPSFLRKALKGGIEGHCSVKLLYERQGVQISLLRYIDGTVIAKEFQKAYLTKTTSLQLQREIAIHKNLQHPSIISFYGYRETAESVTLFLEPCLGGTLFQRTLGSSGDRSMPEKEAVLSVILPLLKGIGYLHSKDILHRDIKLENILFASPSDASPIKLCDFGFAINGRLERPTTALGTLACMPRELLTQGTDSWLSLPPSTKMVRGPDLETHGPAVDIWSLGVTAFEILAGRSPWGASTRDRKELLSRIDRGLTFPPHISPEATAFIAACLQLDPAQRPSADELLKSPLVMKYAHLAEPQAPSPTAVKAKRHSEGARSGYGGGGNLAAPVPLSPVPHHNHRYQILDHIIDGGASGSPSSSRKQQSSGEGSFLSTSTIALQLPSIDAMRSPPQPAPSPLGRSRRIPSMPEGALAAARSLAPLRQNSLRIASTLTGPRDRPGLPSPTAGTPSVPFAPSALSTASSLSEVAIGLPSPKTLLELAALRPGAPTPSKQPFSRYNSLGDGTVEEEGEDGLGLQESLLKERAAVHGRAKEALAYLKSRSNFARLRVHSLSNFHLHNTPPSSDPTLSQLPSPSSERPRNLRKTYHGEATSAPASASSPFEKRAAGLHHRKSAAKDQAPPPPTARLPVRPVKVPYDSY